MYQDDMRGGRDRGLRTQDEPPRVVKRTSEVVTENELCQRGSNEPQQGPPGGNYSEPEVSEDMPRESEDMNRRSSVTMTLVTRRGSSRREREFL